MAIKTYTLGPGTLNLGAGATAFAAQVRSCTVKASENVTSSDDIPVLSGEVIQGTDTADFDWTIEGTFLQDIDAAGINEFAFTNRGVATPFEFTPNTAAGAEASGQCYPVPLDFGGDVQNVADQAGNPPTADFSWRIKGDPAFVWG